jgi:hypothetical protein
MVGFPTEIVCGVKLHENLGLRNRYPMTCCLVNVWPYHLRNSLRMQALANVQNA